MVLSNDSSNSESYVPTGEPSLFSSELSTLMLSHFRSIELTTVHDLSQTLMLFFNSSKGPYLTLQESHSDMKIGLYYSLCILVPSMLPSVCFQHLTKIHQVIRHTYNEVILQV